VRYQTFQTLEKWSKSGNNPNLRNVFNQFHNNLYIAAGQGPAAPGLHNGSGGEIVATGC